MSTIYIIVHTHTHTHQPAKHWLQNRLTHEQIDAACAKITYSLRKISTSLSLYVIENDDGRQWYVQKKIRSCFMSNFFSGICLSSGIIFFRNSWFFFFDKKIMTKIPEKKNFIRINLWIDFSKSANSKMDENDKKKILVYRRPITHKQNMSFWEWKSICCLLIW